MVSQSSQPLKFAPEIDPSKRPWDCKALTAILGVHVLCLAAPFFFSWSGLVVCLVFCWLGGGIGITLAYHRLLTHHSFTTPNWFKYLISLCGCLQWQGGPIRWVGTHRLHHRDSDQEADPHTPRHGFTWAHMTWCLRLDGDGFEPFEAAKDLSKDPIMCLIEKYFYIPQFVLMGVLFGAGYAYGHYVPGGAGEHSPLYMGMSWFIWGVAVRTVLSYHGTWFVNSAAHTWGYQNFKTTDDSRNTWWVALVSFGEGWHNNHHAFQRSAAHGLRWFEFDMTYLTIRLLGLVGLAKNIVLPDRESMAKRTKVKAFGDPDVASSATA